MPWIMQMVGFALLLLGVGVALWVSFWLLLFLFGVGVAAVLWTHTRDYLLRKGILNPTPGVPPQEGETSENITIEGSYKRVDSE